MERQRPFRRISDTLITVDAEATRTVQRFATKFLGCLATPFCIILKKEKELKEFKQNGEEVALSDYKKNMDRLGK